MARHIRRTILKCGLLAMLVPVGAGAQQRQGACNLHSVQGSYGFTESGTIVGFGPYASVGIIAADGKGGFTGAFSESANGAIGKLTFTGAYKVNEDCTGTADLTDSLGRKGTRAFVIVQAGKEIMYLFTDSGFVATGVARKL